MRGALLMGKRDIQVHDLFYPEVKPGAVVLQVTAVGICGTDLHAYRNTVSGRSAPDGHEYVGTVVELGEGVSSLRLGQRVVCDPFLCSSCGTCAYCLRGLTFHCQNRVGHIDVGGFGNYVSVREKGCFPLPDEVDDSLGSLVEPLAVATHAVRMLKVRPGMSGVVIGGGTIGLCALAAAQYAGAKDVYVVARYPAQQKLALTLGAAAIISPDEIPASGPFRETYPFGVDFAIEAVGGSAPTLEKACQLVRPAGAIGVLGAFDPGYRGFELLPALLKEVSVHMSNCYGARDGRHDFEQAIEQLTRRGDKLRLLVTHRFDLEKITEAFRLADDKASGSIKVLITMPEHGPTRALTFFQRINFSDPGIPEGLVRIEGLHDAEIWGRWSDGKRVIMQFRDPMPEKFTLQVAGRSFGPNASKRFTATVSGVNRDFSLPAEIDGLVILQFENPTRECTLVLQIPEPASPLTLGMNGDARMLGLGLVSIIISG
ncbi:MAG: zinc-binding dehydrogenase [Betaproteobacteria bacterium]|nr:zinc-binding dehydrogenase [Betaproteobacteria bacterium]